LTTQNAASEGLTNRGKTKMDHRTLPTATAAMWAFLIAAVMVPLFRANAAGADACAQGTFIITRLNNGRPIITEAMFDALGAPDSQGNNINGPSVIRVPDWIAPEYRADHNAAYYMYFAHHAGNYIRMAWAPHIEGPWNLYQVGSGVAKGDRGVLDLDSSDRINIGNGITIYGHIASPDVFVDEDNQRIVMYFHGPTQVNGGSSSQKSLVATSSDGLDFAAGIQAVRLGRF